MPSNSSSIARFTSSLSGRKLYHSKIRLIAKSNALWFNFAIHHT
jgi:hypothetical protein